MSGTYISKIPVLVVALVIGIVLVTSAVVPLASDYSDAKTFTNDGYYRMKEYDNTASFTAKWDHTDPNAFTVDGTKYNLPTTQQSIDLNLMCAESFFLRYNVLTGYVYVQAYGETFAGSYIARTDQNQDMDITVSSGSVTFDTGGNTTPKTVTYSTMYVISNAGEYVLKKPTDNAYVLGDSTIVAIGHSAYNIDTYLIGNIDDGFTREYRSPSAPGSEVTNFTFSDVTVDDSEVSGYIDLYSLLKLTWTATNTDTSTTYDTIYSQFLVPYQVSADPDNPVAYKNLVKVVPLMAFIMLVVAAAGMVYFKNKD